MSDINKYKKKIRLVEKLVITRYSWSGFEAIN